MFVTDVVRYSLHVWADIHCGSLPASAINLDYVTQLAAAAVSSQISTLFILSGPIFRGVSGPLFAMGSTNRKQGRGLCFTSERVVFRCAARTVRCYLWWYGGTWSPNSSAPFKWISRHSPPSSVLRPRRFRMVLSRRRWKLAPSVSKAGVKSSWRWAAFWRRSHRRS